MKLTRQQGLFLAIIVALGLAVFSEFIFFQVDQTQTAIVLQLGKPVGGAKGPGLHLKLPFVQNVLYYDTRLLSYDAEPREVITKDKKNLKVDNYARWRIENPLLFYKSVRDEYGAQTRLDDIIYSLLREKLGQYDLIDIVSNERARIMEDVTKLANQAARQYGISINDVRIMRADLPPENEKHVYDRMRAERTRQAKRYRAEGEEAGRKLTSQADKERDIILAEAYRKAEMIRGEGDAESTRIYAEAFNKDPEFYAFLRSISVYKESLKSTDVLVLDPNDPLFKYLQSDKGR